MGDVIRIESLTKKYDNLTAVDNISLNIKQGVFFAFLGPNGAGKSTTINVLCTLLPQTSGRLYVDGFEVGRQNGRIRESIGIVFQDSVLDPLLTVQENLISRAAFYDLKKTELTSRIEEIGYATGIREFIRRPYGKLSGGQRRRADIARALVNTPKLLFLDEPTTGLDPQTRKNVWNMLKKLQAKHEMTIFLTTHYMEEAGEADHVAIIDYGKIVAEGTPAELKAKYSTDTLKLMPKDDGDLETYLANENYEYEKQAGRYTIPVDDSLHALRILKKTERMLAHFEMLQGNMDDVFIHITGHSIREEGE